MSLAAGKTISKRERQTDDTLKDPTSLVYGEIELDSFAVILNKVMHTHRVRVSSL